MDIIWRRVQHASYDLYDTEDYWISSQLKGFISAVPMGHARSPPFVAFVFVVRSESGKTNVENLQSALFRGLSPKGTASYQQSSMSIWD